MAGGKETPRQKMIGMMYLFLTALLALNIAKEVVLAFVTINHSIEETNSNFSVKLGSQYSIFKAAYDKNPGKVQKYWNSAQEIQKEASATIAYLNELKARVVAFSETGTQDNFKQFMGKDKNGNDTILNLHYLSKGDDYDSPTYVLIGSEPESPSKDPYSALDAIGKMQKFRDVLNKNCSDNKDMVKRFTDAFAFHDGPDHEGKIVPWGVHNFYHTPVVASIAIISKMQSDVKNAESEAIEYLLTKIDATDIKISKIIPVVSIKSALISPGDSLVAKISVGAIDTTKNPTITVQGKSVNVKGGIGYLSERVASAGDQVWKGVIKYETPLGVVDLPFEIPFKVASATDAVIDPAAMNVLYPGIANPINVSVPGADSEKLNLSCNNSKIRISKIKPGQYEVTPNGAFTNNEKIQISVSGMTTTGGNKNFGFKEFRMKPLPKPEPFFAGKGPADNDVSLGALKEATKMTAILRDFVFEGVKYRITRFTLNVQGAGGDIPFPSNSDQVTDAMREQISKMRPKQRVTFTDIRAVGPDGVEKLLPGMSLKIK